MQVLQDNFFYHSNPRLGADGGLASERQLLAEEQKLCRARSRKFSVETNRRRKALAERQKQWDMQEQQLRENILQQRRQQLQDATERFQRAHLPPSQRRRQSFKRNVLNIEDALNQIQGSLGSYSRQSSFLSSTANASSCSPPPKPPTVSKSSHRQALSALEAYTKLLQEQSRTEKLQDPSPQGTHLSDCCNSESPLSKDSLDNEETNPSPKNLQCSFSSFLLHSEKTHPEQRKQNDLCPTSDLTSFSAMRLLGDNSRKLLEPKQRKQEDSDWPSDKANISEASWGFTPKAKTQPAQHNCNLLSLCEIMSGDPEHFEVKSQQNSPSDNTEANREPDPNLQRTHEDRRCKYPSATDVPSPPKNGNSKDLNVLALPKSGMFLSDTTTNNVSTKGTLQQTGRENRPVSSQKEHSAFINNLNKVSSSEPKTEKAINMLSQQKARSSNIQSDMQKCPEEDVHRAPVSVATSHSVCEVQFIKGILKKQSKYLSGDATCVYGSGHLMFAKQVALAIRDSVELTRTKASMGGNSAVKKKLRWFDELEAKEQNLLKQIKGRSKHNLEDHQLSLTAVSGTPSMTSAASAGYHFTKEAWADVGVQVSLPYDRADEVKVPRSSNRTAGPKVPWRERPARAGAGPVSSRTRKGTVMRPQYATEVGQIARTQGKAMVPRPPPRMEPVEEKTPCITRTPYGMDPVSIHYKPALAVEQALHKNNSEAIFSTYTQHVLATDSAVMYTPLPPTHTCPFSDAHTKSTLTSGLQETHNHCRRRGAAYNERDLCLDCTPTDKEISQLWHGVRAALSTKDAKSTVRRQAQESGRAARKPSAEQSRPSASNRRSLLSTQPPKSTSEPVRPFLGTHHTAFPNEGFDSEAQLHLAAERDMMAAMETAQTERPVQQRTAISLEEQKILLSLDRLNHQLHCVHEHMVGNTGMHGLLMDAPHTKDVKGTNHYKHRASSRPRSQKKV
ncbi:centrosomal protein of 126 kDa [Parambassis ranga]|uniref:Centrosomal protein of 126 kDa n=1 Tax=Parambassis ranga TaxID=210632 RepID=A0A6P7JKE7_9TELE|nr:centrosomal protein of 126 kDa [Parambassis ranga]